MRRGAYGALNMPPQTLLEGLAMMEEAIEAVQRKGPTIGN